MPIIGRGRFIVSKTLTSFFTGNVTEKQFPDFMQKTAKFVSEELNKGGASWAEDMHSDCMENWSEMWLEVKRRCPNAVNHYQPTGGNLTGALRGSIRPFKKGSGRTIDIGLAVAHNIPYAAAHEYGAGTAGDLSGYTNVPQRNFGAVLASKHKHSVYTIKDTAGKIYGGKTSAQIREVFYYHGARSEGGQTFFMKKGDRAGRGRRIVPVGRDVEGNITSGYYQARTAYLEKTLMRTYPFVVGACAEFIGDGEGFRITNTSKSRFENIRSSNISFATSGGSRPFD